MVARKTRGSLTVRWRAKDGKPGTDGDDAVTYDIVPSVSVLKANPDGTVVSDGIIVRAYRTEGDVRSLNILPENNYPESGDYYFTEYSIDGGTWRQCGMFYYPTGPSDDIEWIDKYGIGYQVVETAKEGIAFRLKHSSNPNVVLKEIPQLRVVPAGADNVDVVCSVKQINVRCDSAGNAASLNTAMSFQLMTKSGTTAYCSGVSVVSKPSGVTTQTHSDVSAIPVYGLSCTVAANTSKSDFEGNVIVQVTGTVSGLTYTKRHIIPVVAQINGAQGIDGCIRRIREWKVGEEYRNDKALVTDGLRYIDIAVKKQNGKVVLACQCLKTHIATAELMPQDSTYTTVDNVRYWEKLNNLSSIYTPFIWADDAVFQFAQTNQLVVLKENTDTVNVALGGGTFPFWVGATQAGLNANNQALAPFQIKDNGEFWATNAHISGEINASSGTIAGFKISVGSIINETYFIENKRGIKLVAYGECQIGCLTTEYASAYQRVNVNGQLRVTSRSDFNGIAVVTGGLRVGQGTYDSGATFNASDTISTIRPTANDQNFYLPNTYSENNARFLMIANLTDYTAYINKNSSSSAKIRWKGTEYTKMKIGKKTSVILCFFGNVWEVLNIDNDLAFSN